MSTAARIDSAVTTRPASSSSPDWAAIVRICLRSRALDDFEEQLVPKREVLYQFSARGHELSQAIAATHLRHPDDGIAVYYRSRPLMLGLGFEPEDALAATMMRAGSMTEGRDIGVVFNRPGGVDRPTVLPSCGGVGAQYTPAVGWAQALKDRAERLGDTRAVGALAFVHGGDASTATNGFWAAVNIAAVRQLPVLFFIEDNGYGISVPSSQQTPGGNVAATLAGLANLAIIETDANRPSELAERIDTAFRHVRSGTGPVLLRVLVPRLNGHSYQDNQAYKQAEVIELERARDPIVALQHTLVPGTLDAAAWRQAEDDATARVEKAYDSVKARPLADATAVHRYRFAESCGDGTAEIQTQGGLAPINLLPASGTPVAAPAGPRINMIAGIRRTLEHELAVNPRMVLFGEDVGLKGGVHGVTAGLQDRFGDARVFDTSLSEEGIIGRAVGMALAGLLPVPEIQFRKYAEPATEQLVDCGTMRWRTANRFAAPMVVRMPGGFAKCGDPWHSMTNEAFFLHAVGWRVAYPSNAEDAVGLLRSALRGNDPTVFFEHRALLDSPWSRRQYPGDDFVVPFGVARTLHTGARATIVTWGAMVERCEQAIHATGIDATLIDLRSLMPWDREVVLASVRRTRRCMIVHEDQKTAGFGAEIAAVVARELFFDLDAPVERLAMDDIPSPHAPVLLEAAVPTAQTIGERLRALCEGHG